METTLPTPQATGGGNILGAAFLQYGQGTGSKNNVPANQVGNPSAQYEYGQPGRTGKDTDGDGFREVDCSVLVLNGLRNAGYNVPGVVPNSENINFTTATLFNTPTLGKGELTDAAKQNFDKVEKADLKPGDIVLFSPNKVGNAQHMGIYYGQDAAGNVMFYGSQSSTGPDIATILDTGKLNYWGGAGTTFFTALRPKPELYVPEMDLTGGAGTGLSSDKVIAAVNLLKSSNVEGYRANIYSNNTLGNGDGVPTVGNGLGLVVKGRNGWVVRPENEIKDILRDAGLPESKYYELPLDKLKESANLLNQSRLADARAVFGTGEAGGFSVSPAEADKLSASFVIRNVIPSMVRSFGDAESFALLEPGEFAAAASKVYQSPGWLQSTQGKKFIDAWWSDDSAAAQAALGMGIRGSAEANAYSGNISTTNEYLSSKNTGESGNDPAPSVGGHWEYPATSYNALGDFPGASERVWVSDKPAEGATSATGATTSPTPASNSASASTQSASAPYTSNSTTTHHKAKDGDGITVNFTVLKTSPNGALIEGDVVTYVQDADGRTTYQSLRRTVGKETILTEQVKDPDTDEVVNTKSVWRGKGPDSLQFQEQRDDANNLVGPRYVKDGEAYYKSLATDGATQWLNERGQTEHQWHLDPTNPRGPKAVNGLDLQSDSTAVQTEVSFNKLSDEDLAQILQGAQNILASADNTRYTVAGTGIQTDGGVITGYGDGASTAQFDPTNNYTHYLNNAGNTLNPVQQDVLAAQLQSLNLGGTDALSFIMLSGGSTVITNVDGEIIGEISALKAGFIRLVSNRINEDGSTEPIVSYVAPNGQPADQQDYEKAADAAQAGEGASAVSLMNSVIGLQNWEHMSDLQRTAAVASIYNVVDKISGNALPDLGTTASVLGLLNALDKGDVGGITVSGIALGNALSESGLGASQAIGSALGMDAANVIPALNLALALDSGDPVSIMAAAANFIPGYGQVISACISLFGGMFSEPPDIPMREGIAHAQWDGQGNTQVVTDQDVEGGGATAAGWMNSLVTGLQAQLASTHDAAGHSYALIPNLLPSIGFQYDPDGFNLANGAKGFMVLRWTDESGQLQTRYYDGAGSRGDGSGETLAGDFMTHAQGAIAPDWQVATALAHYQQGQGIQLPNAEAGLPHAIGEGMHQSMQALSLALPTEPTLTDALIDVDGDGYLERTQWLASNQSVLAVDANGDGRIGAGELLKLDGAGLNSLAWLDANNDKLLDARDPAFAALRLWIDLNSDGNSNSSVQDETQTLAKVGITGIDFGSHPPSIIHADGSRQALTIQSLTGDIFGVKYQAVAGGVLQIEEQADGTGVATLNAINTQAFDGQAEHMHGGDVDTDGGAVGTVQTLGAQDRRISTSTANTITTGTNKNIQASTTVAAGDTRLQNGTAGTVVAGQALSNTPLPRSNSTAIGGAGAIGLAFVPSAAASAGDAIHQATAGMMQSAMPGLFDTASSMLPLVAYAVGAAAVQWPVVTSAATRQGTEADTVMSDADAAMATTSSTGTGAAINWQTWDGSRVSVAAMDSLAAPAPLASADSSAGEPIANAVISASVSPFDASNRVASYEQWAQPAINSGAYTGAYAGTDDLSPSESSVSPDASSAASLLTPAFALGHTQLDFPRVQGEQADGTEDITLRFAASALLANDSTVNAAAYPDQPGLRITSVFAPLHGSVSLQTNALGVVEVVFAPEANYHGPASFSYTVTDQYGLSSRASVALSLTAVNDAPVTVGEAAAGDEDHTLQFSAASLLANDSDVDSAVDGDVLRITRVGTAQHGQVFLAPDGTVSFVPDANYNGTASFTYWVGDRAPAQITQGVGYETPASMQLTILPVNDLPVVIGESVTSDEDIILSINPALLLANDSDVDAAPGNTGNTEPDQVLGITAVGNARHGSVALLPDGTLQFTPERDYFGAASFEYTVDDGQGGQVVGTTVINLAPVNDAPVVVAETVSFNEDEIQTITAASLLANDSDVDNPHADLHIISVDNATHGSVALNPDGSIRFAPAPDYFGAASFTYTVSDGVGGFTVGMASLDIAPVNDAPRLTGETLTLDEDTEAHFSITSLLGNDMDVDNPRDALTITAAGNATHGSVQVVDGELVFTPTLNFNGQVSFTYTVSDGVGGLSEATVNLAFNPVNDAPVANSELIWGKRDISYTLSQSALLANDTDVESPADLHISAIGNVQHGTAALNPNGSVHFVPEAGYAGRGSFDYTVMDPDGAASTATAQIDFSHINLNPTATDDSFTGYEDVPFSITQAQLLVNDRDVDNPASDLRVTAVNHASHGTVSLQADGTIRFVADADFYGNASFTYQVSDGEGGETWAMAQLSVQSVNDAPVIEDVWCGRPIYGYNAQIVYGYSESGVYGPVGQTLVAISNESQARSLLSSGQLTGSSGSFYLNGHLRPVGFNNMDANSGNESGTLIDDPYRQNGGIVAYDPDGNSEQISFSVGGSPQHGHAWANLYTSSNAPGSIDHTQAGPYWVGETGAWQYYSQRGDGYSGGDAFTITATDGGGASSNATVYANHTGSSAGGGGGGKKPVTLDLDGNGLHYVGLDDSKAYFDVNNDGWREHLAWVSAGDGLLARDIGGDRVIDRFDEISFAGYLAGAKTDLEGLVAFDGNGDGLLSRLDARWQEFGIWQDANGDGVSQAGEFHSLDEVGVIQIGLASDHQIREVDGVTELGQSLFTWADGHTGAVGDVVLPVDPSARQAVTGSSTTIATEPHVTAIGLESRTQGSPVTVAHELLPAQADNQLPEPQSAPQTVMQLTPEHLALLMVQMINTVTAARESEPSGSIVVQDAQDFQQALVATQTEWGQTAQTGAAQLHGIAS